MANKQNYQYVITLDTPIFPRKLADWISADGYVADHLVSVTDLQNDTHIYGDTFYARWEDYLANAKRRGQNPVGYELRMTPPSLTRTLKTTFRNLVHACTTDDITTGATALPRPGQTRPARRLWYT